VVRESLARAGKGGTPPPRPRRGARGDRGRPLPLPGAASDRPRAAWKTRVLGAVQVTIATTLIRPRLLVRGFVRKSYGTAPVGPVPVAVDAAGTRPSPPASTRDAGRQPSLAGSALEPSGSGRVVNVVAHPDDDLIFMSPDLLVDLRAAEAVRTVFLTSGDGGRGHLYAVAREEGVRRAYAAACGVANLWDVCERSSAGVPVTVSVLRGDRRVSLAFVRLPDGSPEGGGTGRGRRQSLQKLLEGDLQHLQQMRTSTPVTLHQLIDVLVDLLTELRPTATRALDYAGAFGNGDHSDHVASARMARAAHERLPGGGWLTGYLGYTTSALPVNVPSTWVRPKTASIETYSRCDPAFRLGFDPRWVSRQYVSARERRPPGP
jgi:LmbE family N-acetylglucosaminyl deacetylase